ncbi:prepilin-type N-terminal cleavage/methylation domain-containing protein [Hyphobacterium sp.]|uniref:prepilin-type N-terminal cleavage/methylation domain-containing protein n=1 Tax=Hyphobacterium sp. TaxID=2004662 RepID=UPI003BACE869
MPETSTKAGYSLLEVLLTVTLIALVGAITAPSILNQIERREERLALAALETGMTRLRYEAVLAATPLEIGPAAINARFSDLPEGWRVSADAPLQVSSGGLCDGETVLTLTSPDNRLWRRRPAAPDCQLERL